MPSKTRQTKEITHTTCESCPNIFTYLYLCGARLLGEKNVDRQYCEIAKRTIIIIIKYMR